MLGSAKNDSFAKPEDISDLLETVQCFTIQKFHDQKNLLNWQYSFRC
jgi:hypothetical protein